VVVVTGAATEIGRISGLLSEVETLTTPLVAPTVLFDSTHENTTVNPLSPVI
jgi:hypothetical protein